MRCDDSLNAALGLVKRVGNVCLCVCVYAWEPALAKLIELSVGHKAIWFVVITYKIN